jgi:hypothetical protein
MGLPDFGVRGHVRVKRQSFRGATAASGVKKEVLPGRRRRAWVKRQPDGVETARLRCRFSRLRGCAVARLRGCAVARVIQNFHTNSGNDFYKAARNFYPNAAIFFAFFAIGGRALFLRRQAATGFGLEFSRRITLFEKSTV